MIPTRQIYAEDELTANWSMFKREEEELEAASIDNSFEEFYSKEKQRNGVVARGECGRESLLLFCFSNVF